MSGYRLHRSRLQRRVLRVIRGSWHSVSNSTKATTFHGLLSRHCHLDCSGAENRHSKEEV